MSRRSTEPAGFAVLPPDAEPLLRNLEQVGSALMNRLLEPDLLRLLQEFGVKNLEGFVDSVFDRAAALWTTVPATDRVEPEFFARTRAAMKTGLGLYRIDEDHRRREFASGEAQGQIWQAYGAASHVQFVDAFIADIAAFQPKEIV